MTDEEMREMTQWFEDNNYIHYLRHGFDRIEDDPDCTCYWCLKNE